MAIPTWPSALPEIRSVSGASIRSLLPKRVVTEVDDGPPIVRVKGFYSRPRVEVNLVMTDLQVPIFLTFIRGTLNGSALAFNAPILTSAGSIATRVCQIVPKDDEPTVTPFGVGQNHVRFELYVEGW